MTRRRVDVNMTVYLLYKCFIIILCLVGCELKKKKDKDAAKSIEFLKKEAERLAKSGSTCPHSIITLSSLDRLRVTKQHDKSLACSVRYLEKNPDDSWAWSSLGSTLLQQGSSKATSRASTCFKAASRAGGKVSQFVRLWHYLGPFTIGKMELDGDPVASLGGIQAVAGTRYRKQQRFISELAPGGLIGWTVYKQTQKTDTIIVQPQIDWNDLINSMGSTAILEWQGWAVGEFAVNEDGLSITMQCLGIHTMYVDDMPVTGDVYHRDVMRFSIDVGRGIHTVYLQLRAKGRMQFKCTIDSPISNMQVLPPHFLPDLYDGHLFSTHIALPINNLSPNRWLRNIRISLDPMDTSSLLTITQLETLPIAPGQMRPVILKLTPAQNDGVAVDVSCSGLDLQLQVSCSACSDVMHTLSLRCRQRHESFIFTFIDHDGSVQQAATIEPIEGCPDGPCPILLTLHGTTVPPQNQADSYKHMVDDDFVFGFPTAWTLAPTRHGAHNWEGPGALTAIQALDELDQLSRSATMIKNPASSRHVIFAGHSMGGHGAWHLATHLPDRGLAVISLAGWIKKEEYGDSNVFFRHDIATTNVDPAVKAIMEACIAENEADRFAPNLQGLPVLIRIGAADRTIHPLFTRRMYRILQRLNINVTYTELPGKQHWWWDTWETNDGGAVHDPQLRNFTNHYAVIPNLPGKPLSQDHSSCTSPDDLCSPTEEAAEAEHTTRYSETSQGPQNFTTITINPALGESVRGVRVLQQKTPFRMSTIRGEITDEYLNIMTTNVQRFTITEPPNRPTNWQRKTIKVDGKDILLANVWKDSSVCVCQEKVTWKLCSDCDNLESATRRGPSNLGPARRVAEKPFLIVTGTQGDVAVSKQLLVSAVYLANLFFLTSDTNAPVITDSELTIDLAENYNLIVIGTPAQNSWTSRYLDLVPMTFENGELRLGSCTFNKTHSGTAFLAPHGRHLALVLMATSPGALRDVISLGTPTIPPMTRSPFSNLLPDFVVTGPMFAAYGPGGYDCAGFWGNSWDFRSELASCSYCADIFREENSPGNSHL